MSVDNEFRLLKHKPCEASDLAPPTDPLLQKLIAAAEADSNGAGEVSKSCISATRQALFSKLHSSDDVIVQAAVSVLRRLLQLKGGKPVMIPRELRSCCIDGPRALACAPPPAIVAWEEVNLILGFLGFRAFNSEDLDGRPRSLVAAISAAAAISTAVMQLSPPQLERDVQDKMLGDCWRMLGSMATWCTNDGMPATVTSVTATAASLITIGLQPPASHLVTQALNALAWFGGSSDRQPVCL